ncbi:uncharacterized protein LOC127542365 isoform X2 [Antechinus flavipes]|uniref:uncharacterized protein LOC127542365 isoform X2 n=1 Tax=Antechinus flavipes TaxID=38775 RepID=UPI002235D957|nr:uncharacterized protein LOC127542365 isoform X2 [Antechinus flavipes]
MRATRSTVRILGSWACHHSGADPPGRETFCIQMHPWQGPDCQVQPGSPVLCRFGNRQELVGLVGEPGKACSTPILAVRTAPYHSWLDAVARAAWKQIPSLPCMLFPPSSPYSHPRVHPAPYSALEEADSGIDSVRAQWPFPVTPSPGDPAKAHQLPPPRQRSSHTRLPLATTRGLPKDLVKSLFLPLGIPPAAKARAPTPSARSSAREPRGRAPTSQIHPGPVWPLRDLALGRLAADGGASQQGMQTARPEPQAAVGMAQAPAPLGLTKVGNLAQLETHSVTEAARVHTPSKARPSGVSEGAPPGPQMPQPATGRPQWIPWSQIIPPAARGPQTPWPQIPWPPSRQPQWIPQAQIPRPAIRGPLTSRPPTPWPATGGSLTSRPPTPWPATGGSLTSRPPTPWPATGGSLTSRPPTPWPATGGSLTSRPPTPWPATGGSLTSRPPTPWPATGGSLNPRPAAHTVAPWAHSHIPWPSGSQTHPTANADRPQTPAAVGSQTHSATDVLGAWLLPFQTVPAVLKSNTFGARAQLTYARARPWMAPDSEVAPEAAGPWVLQTPAAGQLPGQAPSGAGPWALAETEVPGPWSQRAAEPQSEGSLGARLAAPLPQPVAEAAGFWTTPAPAIKAIIPWPGPVSEMASEAIVPWAGPAPTMVQGLDLRNLPGTASGVRLPPSPALFSGSLTYWGPFLSPVLPLSPQSVPPAPAHSRPPLFSGALQALAWGPPGPSVPKSQPGSDSSGAGPSGIKDQLAPSSFPTSSAPSPFPSSAHLSSLAGPSRSRSPVPDLRHRLQQEQPLRVTLDQCLLGLGWRSSFQAYWLFQTALSSEQGPAECGARPGFAARCPTCWEAEEGEFPWVVSLQFSLSHFCSGSILNEWWVLTTASCANFIRNSEALAQVQAGVTDLEDQVRAQLVGIHRVLPYFGLEGPTGLGLILLKEPLRFQPRTLAVCLEEPSKRPAIQPRRHLHDCWVPGWTLIEGNLVTMQKRRLDVVEVSNCARFWPIESSMAFCVEAKKVTGQSSCKGDLGAPLMCRPKPHPEDAPWVQMGVLTAFDETCTRPYVFSRIHPFSLWLKASTKSQHPPWVQTAPRPTLSSLLQPEALVNRISLSFATPWQALIVTCDSRLCGGSILSPSWILTSAHCIRHMRTENMAVFLGLPQPGGNMTVARVSSVVLHERYQLVDGVPWNDLALVLLQKPLGSSQPLAPVGHVDDVNKAECWLTGPRELREGETDRNPQALHVQVKDALSCARHLPGSIRNSVLCLAPWVPEYQVALDLMGPGSALLCRSRGKNGTWRQTGLTSIRSLTFLLAPYFPWISKTSSAQADHSWLSQSVGKPVSVTSAAVAEPRGLLGFLLLLTLWLRFQTA